MHEHGRAVTLQTVISVGGFHAGKFQLQPERCAFYSGVNKEHDSVSPVFAPFPEMRPLSSMPVAVFSTQPEFGGNKVLTFTAAAPPKETKGMVFNGVVLFDRRVANDKLTIT
jgi:hypothetical protein